MNTHEERAEVFQGVFFSIRTRVMVNVSLGVSPSTATAAIARTTS
jgi:hypothetical protein